MLLETHIFIRACAKLREALKLIGYVGKFVAHQRHIEEAKRTECCWSRASEHAVGYIERPSLRKDIGKEPLHAESSFVVSHAIQQPGRRSKLWENTYESCINFELGVSRQRFNYIC